MKHDNSRLPLGRGRVGEAGRAREEIACFIPPSDRHEGESGGEREVRFNPGIYRTGISSSEGSTGLGRNFVKSLTKWNQYFRRAGGAEMSLIIMSAGGGRYGISIHRRSLITFHSDVMDGPRCCLSHDRFAPEVKKKKKKKRNQSATSNSSSLFSLNMCIFQAPSL